MITQDDIQGHWERHWIRAPGFEDHTTRVHWMQAGIDFADVRVPLDRPDTTGATCLADLSSATLAALARAEGFAGHVTLEGDTCTWHREINWHGTPHDRDVGAISFDDQGRLVEAGVLAEYTELWAQRDTAKPRVHRFSNGTYAGVLIVAGSVGVVGIGRASKQATKPLIDALGNGRVPIGADRLFDGLHALCRLDNGRAVATIATNPFVEGQTVLRLSDHAAIWLEVGFDGSHCEIQMPFKNVPVGSTSRPVTR